MSLIMRPASKFNGITSRTIFCLWTGDEVMSENRARALWTVIKNSGQPVAFITKDTISEWVLPDYPLHPAFRFLTSTHKSDYLRCYLMHHYGGGYTDIKKTNVRWKPFFELLEMSDFAFALGYPELPHGMPHLTGPLSREIQNAHNELIGLCTFIFKPASDLTLQWYESLHLILDQKLPLLQSFPGKFSLDQSGLILPNGTISEYPLRWAEILGEILHPLFFKYRNNLIKSGIAPDFTSYR